MSEAKKDCFGYDKITNRCRVLTETCCKNGICRFYKTKKQYDQGIKSEDYRYGKK